MRQETEILHEVTTWAQNNEAIRAMLLTSSRANGKADLLSDYDIEFVINDLPQFLTDDSWLKTFGNIISVVVENEDAFDGENAMRMVYYEDYIKIDFKLYAIDKFTEQVNKQELQEDWDVGYKILLDKDGLTIGMKPFTGKTVTIAKPTEEEFLFIINDAWFCMPYIAKSLWRDQLFYAKQVGDSIMRFEDFQKIIEWYIGMQHDWKINTNKSGRLFKQYLDPALWKRIEATFAGADIEENWKALFAYADLTREMGIAIAEKLQYTYPQALDEKITAYLWKIKHLDRNATDIK
ncbi:aminoglycoside adenylyltransferase [Chitinophaga sp. SYP-B3965]|uniref:aminoglycoside 6-adenylyltransferase n=1 Tax=Chitinophaga sp. SYP-B3965 TaxID=2663120 RepID=UPI001299F672|nr:aminoglycoside 6-adenylyltransferase [Chitinophaga sp. SYP-B3965]MRG48738.1 aminoglycoside adenylyltransferase [Chitinophaga sp. SYP-B3965]